VGAFLSLPSHPELKSFAGRTLELDVASLTSKAPSPAVPVDTTA
jgi:hypothetical protein